MVFYTIGHSNGPFEKFVERLEKHGIKTVADVRSAPVSRYAPWFNYNLLEHNLPRHGISYEFMGDRLGGRPRNPAYVKNNGDPDYDAMARDEAFIEGLEMVERMAENTVFCLMCSEEDPARCHRSRLVSAQLAIRGAEVLHILGDGSIETEEDNAKRRAPTQDNQLDLF